MPVASMGTTLKKGATAIANLTSIDGVGVSADTLETTALDTAGGYRTFIASLKDAGEVSISGHFNYTSHNPLFADFQDQSLDSYTIEFPDRLTTSGTKWTFSAIVTSFSTSVELEDIISFEATLKISGAPTMSAPV
jgi:predicted secreted protein